MNRLPFARVLLISMLSLLTVLPALAANNAIHSTIPFNETFIDLRFGSNTASCVGYTGTVTIIEEGFIYVTEFVDGPNAGRTKYRWDITQTVTFQPDDPAMGPTYSGESAFRMNTIVRSDEEYVQQYHLHFTGASPEGEELKFNLHGVWVFKDGEMKNHFIKPTCIK